MSFGRSYQVFWTWIRPHQPEHSAYDVISRSPHLIGSPDEKADLDLYADYLLSTFSVATATGLSAMVDGDVSHDQITRFLSAQEYTSKDLWRQVKSTVRSVERDVGVGVSTDL